MTIDAKLETVTIVTPIANALKYRTLLQASGGIIDQENERTDAGIHVFVVKNLDALRLKLFDKNDANECYVHYRVATMKGGKYKIAFYTSDTSREKKHISTVYVSYVNGEKEQKICEIFERRDIGAENPTHYTINWGGWGSVDLEVAKMFSEGIQVAIEVVEYCTAKFVK